jgi:hypothetical protein
MGGMRSVLGRGVRVVLVAGVMVASAVVAGCGGDGGAGGFVAEEMPPAAPRGPALSRRGYAALASGIYCRTALRLGDESPDLSKVDRSDAAQDKAVDQFARTGEGMRQVVVDLGALRTRPEYGADAEQFRRSLWEMSQLNFEAAKAVRSLDSDHLKETDDRARVVSAALGSAVRGLELQPCDA